MHESLTKRLGFRPGCIGTGHARQAHRAPPIRTLRSLFVVMLPNFSIIGPDTEILSDLASEPINRFGPHAYKEPPGLNGPRSYQGIDPLHLRSQQTQRELGIPTCQQLLRYTTGIRALFNVRSPA